MACVGVPYDPCGSPFGAVWDSHDLCGTPMTCVGVPYDPHGSPSGTLWEFLKTLVGVPYNTPGCRPGPFLESLGYVRVPYDPCATPPGPRISSTVCIIILVLNLLMHSKQPWA
jgi:hypothetical protein